MARTSIIDAPGGIVNGLLAVLGPHARPLAIWEQARGRVFPGLYALDILTPPADRAPGFVPPLILAAACDGEAGYVIGREDLLAFQQTHRGIPLVVHDAPMRLKSIQLVLGGRIDLYEAVERGEVWDTRILARLLALATEGHTARAGSGLAECCRRYLGLDLPVAAPAGLGRHLGRPPGSFPAPSLARAATDAMAAWLLFGELNRRIRVVLRGSSGVWGYAGDAWLGDAVRRFGPLTHHVQLRSAILMDALSSDGIAIDRRRGRTRLDELRGVMARRREALRRRGFLPDEPGSGRALQSVLREFARAHPEVELSRTPGGEAYSTAEEDLAGAATIDPFFADLAAYRAAARLAGLLERAGAGRVHGDFGPLLETGRTYCGGLNLQGLPREAAGPEAARTIRGCFVPGAGRVFIDADYRQAELVALAHALRAQFGLTPTLAVLINAGRDIHRLLASAVLGRPPGAVTAAERDGVKAIAFGRPGGMGPEGLRRAAAASYGIALSEGQVRDRIAAYHRLCPELDAFLRDEADAGLVLARELGLTPAAHAAATGRTPVPDGRDPGAPQSWLGRMLLRALGEASPATRGDSPRPYSPAELDFLWGRAQGLAAALGPGPRGMLAARRADRRLQSAVLEWAGRRSAFTLTGRLRARAGYCGSRNTVFQGLAADGAILGLWRVWRAGYRVVNFVHDQVVVEVADDDRVPAAVAEVVGLMRQGMAEAVPGMVVGVDARVTHSLDRNDLHPGHIPSP